MRVEVGEIALADKSAEIAVDVLARDDRGKGFEKFGKVGVMGGFFQSDYLRRASFVTLCEESTAGCFAVMLDYCIFPPRAECAA